MRCRLAGAVVFSVRFDEVANILHRNNRSPSNNFHRSRSILLLRAPMDELLQNSEALAETFMLYRELVGHYVVSNNPHAIEMRAHMRRHNHGAFLPSLYQDLSDICTYFERTIDVESWDESAVSDLRGALGCLSSLVCIPNTSEVSLCVLRLISWSANNDGLV